MPEARITADRWRRAQRAELRIWSDAVDTHGPLPEPIVRARGAWYRATMDAHLPAEPGRVLELGGAGSPLLDDFPGSLGVAADPLQTEYSRLFSRRQLAVAAMGEALPFAEAAFDTVLCANVLDHTLAPARVVAELARVIRPTGRLLVTMDVYAAVYLLVNKARRRLRPGLADEAHPHVFSRAGFLALVGQHFTPVFASATLLERFEPWGFQAVTRAPFDRGLSGRLKRGEHMVLVCAPRS